MSDYTEIPMGPPPVSHPTTTQQYPNRLSNLLNILILILLVFFIYHLYRHAYARHPFLHHHDRHHRHPHRLATANSQLFSLASDDCTMEHRGACYGVVSQSLFTATRKCQSGLVATTCRCMSPDGATLESYGLQDNGLCQCTFATRRPRETTWVMWLLCFNPDPTSTWEEEEQGNRHTGRGAKDRVQPAKLPTFGRLKEAYA